MKAEMSKINLEFLNLQMNKNIFKPKKKVYLRKLKLMISVFE